MWIYNRIEKLGARYNKSLQNCMHASFLVASELLIPAQHNILLCTFQYETKSHMVAAKNKLYFDLWVGVIINLDYKIQHKFSFFDEEKFNRFYVKDRPRSIKLITIEYLNG